MTPPAAAPFDAARVAVAEYDRRKRRAIAAANNAGQGVQGQGAARFERQLRCWLSIVLRAGGTHPDAGPVLDVCADRWPRSPDTARQEAAFEIATLADCHAELARARDVAILAADGPGAAPSAVDRARALRRLADHFGVTIPFQPAAPAAQQEAA